MRRIWLLLFLIGCSSNTPITLDEEIPIITEEQEEPLELKIEPLIHDSQAPVAKRNSGSQLPVERLLLNGVLDLGDRDAPLTLLIFTEHHCKYCREFHNEILPRLRSDYIDKGLLRMQIAAFPLKKYSDSLMAAKAAYCSAKQNKGMHMQSVLFEQAYKHNTAVIAYAKEMELDIDLFVLCLDNPDTEAVLSLQQDWARTLGVEHVPTFFLNGGKFVGLPYYAELRGRIDAALQP